MRSRKIITNEQRQRPQLLWTQFGAALENRPRRASLLSSHTLHARVHLLCKVVVAVMLERREAPKAPRGAAARQRRRRRADDRVSMRTSARRGAPHASPVPARTGNHAHVRTMQGRGRMHTKSDAQARTANNDNKAPRANSFPLPPLFRSPPLFHASPLTASPGSTDSRLRDPSLSSQVNDVHCQGSDLGGVLLLRRRCGV